MNREKEVVSFWNSLSSYDEVGEVIAYSEGYYNMEMQHDVVNYDV